VFEVLHHVDIKHHAASCSGIVWQSILGLTAPGFHSKELFSWLASSESNLNESYL
jgi:hypothetical protein